ncbi:hypothetical protein pb186bvf_013719 [Paramecium bursaria]
MLRILGIQIYRFCNLEAKYQESLQNGLKGVNDLIKQYKFNKGSNKLANIIKKKMPDKQLINDYQSLIQYSNLCQELKYEQGYFLLNKLVDLIKYDNDEKYIQYQDQIKNMVNIVDHKSFDIKSINQIGDDKKSNFLNKLLNFQSSLYVIDNDPHKIYKQIVDGQDLQIQNKITRNNVIKLLRKNNQDEQIIIKYMIDDAMEYQSYFLNVSLHKNLVIWLLQNSKKLTRYINNRLKNYITEHKILNPSNDSIELIYIYSKVFFRDYLEIEKKLYDLLKYLDFQKLNSTQLSQLLFIIKASKNNDIHVQYQDEITQAITNQKEPNDEDFISMLATIMQLNRSMIDFQSYPPYRCLKEYFVKNISRFPSKLIHLIEITNQNMIHKDQELIDLIEQAAKGGKLDDHLPSLFSYFASLTKRSRQIQVYGLLKKFVQNTDVIQINDGETYQEMCNFITQAIKVGENKKEWMKNVFLKHLNFAEQIDPQQMQHFVHLCIDFNSNQDKLVEQKMRGLKPMPQVFVLNTILQSQTPNFENTKSAIKNYLLNTDGQYEQHIKELNKDAVIYTIFTASLDTDMKLFENLYERFKYQIRNHIDTFIKNSQNDENKVKKVNLQIMQLFQSFIHYQINTGKTLYDSKFQEIVLKNVKNNIFFQYPSFNEDKIAVYLQEKKIKYEQNKYIGPYSVDFYLPEQDKIIDAFGAQHFIGGNLRTTDVLRLKVMINIQLYLMSFQKPMKKILKVYQIIIQNVDLFVQIFLLFIVNWTQCEQFDIYQSIMVQNH